MGHVCVYIYNACHNCYKVMYSMELIIHSYVHVIYYESQPVGLAEVIDASEASLGGPGQSEENVYKQGQIGGENGF